jgi:hypothetical protein
VLKRLTWFTVGTLVGAAVCLWAVGKARSKVRQLRPESVAGQLSSQVQSLAADIRAAAAEGRAAMRSREAELRAELDAARAEQARLGPTRPALPGNPSLN